MTELKGLKEEEVLEKIRNGEDNSVDVRTITVGSIIRKHTFTLFNIVNFILAIIILLFAEAKNAVFIFVVVINAVIAIVNDIRAKRTVDKLVLVAEKRATVLRDGTEIQIDNKNIVKGDIIKYSAGDQIVCDSTIVDGFLEVNESFVTGESNTIKKNEKSALISGSFVIAGTCYARVTAVGENNTTNKILKAAKNIKDDTSELFSTMQKIVKYISFALIPVGILLFINQYSHSGGVLSVAVTSTVSALVSMIPEGLMLLISSVLALATIRLSQKKVLVSDLYSIETLARVDTICLDKTGTITTGNLKVEKVIPVSAHSEREIAEIISLITGNLRDNNSTYTSLVKKFGKNTSITADSLIPFSSERKYSGIRIDGTEYLMGAYSFLTESKKYSEQEQSLSENYRVITVMKRTGKKEEIFGFVLLSDEIRKNAKNLLKYFAENDVAVKIISGDNLGTIDKITKEVNFASKGSVDLSTLEKKNWAELVKDYDVFARVKPEEKKHLVRALEDAGHTVAMTGDGVNDVLALKEADCGISIGSAADAARKVSRLVLLDDDFAAIPDIIREGRRTINNITRSSTLFLNKTFFASTLSIVFIFLPFVYPFTPVEMSIINILTIGVPSFILALEPNFERKKVSFWKNILKYSLPPAICNIICLLVLSIIASGRGFSSAQLSTFSYIITVTIGLGLIARISWPLNKFRGGLLALLIISAILALIIPISRSFFGFI